MELHTPLGELLFASQTARDKFVQTEISPYLFAVWFLRIEERPESEKVGIGFVRQYIEENGAHKAQALLDQEAEAKARADAEAEAETESTDSGSGAAIKGIDGIIRTWVNRRFAIAPPQFRERITSALLTREVRLIPSHANAILMGCREATASEGDLIATQGRTLGQVMPTAENGDKFLQNIYVGEIYDSVSSALNDGVTLHLSQDRAYNPAAAQGRYVERALNATLELDNVDTLITDEDWEFIRGGD